MSRTTRVLFAIVVGVASLWAPAAAGASCVPPPEGQEAWRTADAVFVGTVTSVDNNARWAKVSVEEIWSGPDLPTEVVVRGGPADPNTASSVDRIYVAGIRYLFTVSLVDGNLEDNACSGTTEAESVDLEGMRPADVRAPGTTVAGDDGFDLGALGDLGGPILVAAVIGGLLLTTVLLARRREA